MQKSDATVTARQWTPPTLEIEQAHSDWLFKEAIPFRLKGEDVDVSDLQRLKALIGVARVVQLGVV